MTTTTRTEVSSSSAATGPELGHWAIGSLLADAQAEWESMRVYVRASFLAHPARLVLVLAPSVLLSLGCSRVAPGFTDDDGSDGSPVLDPYPYATQGGSSEESSSTDTDTGPWIPDEPIDSNCDLVAGLTCPDGDKCVPIPWVCCGLFQCVDVVGDKVAGESCFNEGEGSNLDDCDADSYCLDGICRAFCNVQGECAPGSQCLTASSTWVCLDLCDPLAQDCGGGQGCYWNDGLFGFSCRELSDDAGSGQPCIGPDLNCAPGFSCVPESQYPNGCGGGPGCCSNLCDLELGEAACANGPPGSSCSDLELPLSPELGVCVGSNLVPGDLQIVEVWADPPGITIVEAPLEFVEILNLSDKQIDLGLLSFGDFINPSADGILDDFDFVSGDGGCAQVSPLCLAPGRRALFVGNGYVGEAGAALVISSHTALIFGALLQPFTRIKLYDTATNLEVVISSYRSWNDLDIGPWPIDEQAIHRIDFAGPDVTENYVSGPPTPGL